MQFLLTVVGALAVSILLSLGSGGGAKPDVGPSTLVPITAEKPATQTATEPSLIETDPAGSTAPIEPTLTPEPKPATSPTPSPTSAPAPSPRPTPTPKPLSPEPRCHPSYSGCLNPDASDYDCAGGSGNGPYYTGPVRVIGPDVFDLDRDNDGWGCE